MQTRHLRSLAATKRYVASLKRGGRWALEGWYKAHDAQYRLATEEIQQRLEKDLEDFSARAEDARTVAESKAAIRPLLDVMRRHDQDSTSALAEAIIRRPVTLPRVRLRVPKSPPTILGAPAPKPKKISGGQQKYDIRDIRRLIVEHKATHNLGSNHAALCGILFKVCHETERPDLQAKAREMDEALKFHLKTAPHARALIRAVEDVDGSKLKTLEELLRRDRKSEKERAN